MFSTPVKRSDSSFGSDPTPSFTPSAPARSNATIIARGVRVEGEFRSQGDVVIEGDVQGSLSAAGTLTVGSEATIKADINADEVRIAGMVDGNLQVKKQAVFTSSARIKGDIVAERISIEAGAQLDGRIKIGASTVVPAVAEKIDEPNVQDKKEEEEPKQETLPPILPAA